MSEIKTNKIKPALNPTKVKIKTGISVVDPAAPTNENTSFGVNFQGQIQISTPLTLGSPSGATTGAPGSVLLSRGTLSPTWGPIPTPPCPPIPDTGKLWGKGDIERRRNISVPQSDCYRFFSCNIGFDTSLQNSVYEGINTDSSFYSLIWKVLEGSQGGGAGITVNGELYTWGTNNAGRIGNGFSSPSGFYGCDLSVGCPYRIGTQNNWYSVYTTQHWTLATKTDGTLWVWGSNHSTVYGSSTTSNLEISFSGSEYRYRNPFNSGNTTIPSTEPVRVGTDTDWKQVFNNEAITYGIVIALKENGTLWSWGGVNTLPVYNLGYQAPTSGPDLNLQRTPRQIGIDTDWKWATSNNLNYGYGIKTDGSLWGWGAAARGLGIGASISSSSEPQYTPVKISGFDYAAAGPIAGIGRWKKVVALSDSAAGLQEDGSVWVWGRNSLGRRFSLGPTNPITGNAWSGAFNDDGFLKYPVKLDNNVYLDITKTENDNGLLLIRGDGTLWITGEVAANTVDNGNVAFLLRPHQPEFSKSLIWSRFAGFAAGNPNERLVVGAIATEKIVAPTNSTVRWFRSGYTSLTNTCNSSDVVTASVPPPIPPAGWRYCDGTNNTVNMKSWFNPLTGKLDWPPVDNADGCGNSTGLPGQLTHIQKT